jgi:hypothetical protein
MRLLPLWWYHHTLARRARVRAEVHWNGRDGAVTIVLYFTFDCEFTELSVAFCPGWRVFSTKHNVW